jgi:hypothetical protein
LSKPLLASSLCLSLVWIAPGCRSGPDRFVDAAARQGLEFISYSGDRLWYIIDTMGSGAALGDYDGDGDADVFLMTGSAITGAYQEEAAKHADALWRNDGGGKLTNVTVEAGVGRSGWSNGAAFGDYDGDGDLDLFVARHGPDLLYRNEGGGAFVEVGEQAGVADPGWGAGAVWFDYDGDRDLDLYVANYAVFDPVEQNGKVTWFTDGLTQFPHHFPVQDNTLFRNRGDGTFEDVTLAAGAAGTGRSLGVVATDIDDDADLDLYIANDVGNNDLLRNDGGRFVNIGLESGTALDGDGNFQAGMGVAAADCDNDGDIDLFVTNYAGELNTLYRNEGGGFFIDATRSAGLVNQRVLDSVGWGAGIHDFDLDGNLDLLVVNGHIQGDMVLWYLRHFSDSDPTDIPQMRAEAYRAGADQSRLLFLGKGDGTFVDVTDEMGDTFRAERMGRGAAFGDLDRDGRLDVVVTNKNQPAQALLNRMPRRGSWLELELRGRPPNVFAIGARARVHAGGRTLTREVCAGTSYLSADDTVLHFGLGPAAVVDRIEVRWPGGATTVHPGPAINRRHVIHEEAAPEPPLAVPSPAAGPAEGSPAAGSRAGAPTGE